MMRKHWLVPCSVIKWWQDGERGREMIRIGLCAPGQTNIVRCFKQYGYLWANCLFFANTKMVNTLLEYPNRITGSSL